MTFQEILITPAMATAWLEKNTHNRPLRQSVIVKYARDMKSGRWLRTHEAVAIDREGRIVDGQHRLCAIVLADVPVTMMVAFDAEMDSQLVIDCGAMRSPFDVIRLTRGHSEVSRAGLSIARQLCATKRIAHGPTRQEIIQAYDEHRRAIEFVTAAFSAHIRGVSTTPVMVVVARAWYSHDRERLARFCQLLESGKGFAPGDEAALVLRNWLIMGKVAHSHKMTRESMIYGKTARALASFLIHEPVDKLYIPNVELFPLPSEKTKEAGTTIARLKARLGASIAVQVS